MNILLLVGFSIASLAGLLSAFYLIRQKEYTVGMSYILLGAITIAILGGTGAILVLLMSVANLNGWVALTLWAGALISFGIYAASGFRQIEVNHQGVLLLFGTPVGKKVLKNGIFWVPPGIISIIMIDMREQNDVIKEYTFLVQDASKSKGSEVGVEMKISITIQWKAVNPLQILQVTPEVITRGLHDSAIDAVREVSASTPPLTLITEKKKVQDAVVLKLKGLQGRWGIEVGNVIVPMIDFASEAIQTAYDAAFREEQERDAERIELKHIGAEALKLAKKLNIKTEEALLLIQSERGKLTRQQFIHTHQGEGGNQLLDAATLLMQGKK